MARPERIEGYAIVSREGMIATSDRVMPPALKIDADQRFFHGALEHAAAVANGRHSNEGGPHAAARPRLVLTRRIPMLAAHPDNPNVVLWNPAGARFEEAWDRLGVDGVLAVVGGPDVFGEFLAIGYDAFFLSRAPASIPNGRPVFPGVPENTPEALLAEHGMVPQAVRVLDQDSHVTVTQWGRG
jgi:dihydrofolate reductase